MHKLKRHKFRRRTLMLWLCLSILAGLGLAHIGLTIASLWLYFLVPFTAAAWPKRSLTAVVLTLLVGLGLGCWRGSLFQQKLAAYAPYEHQKVTLMARANEDAVYGKTKQLTFMAGDIVLANGQRLAGKIQLSGFGVNAVFQGDMVKVTGKLYPGLGARQGSISFASVQVIKHQPSLVADIRRKFAAGMQTALPEPLAPFAMGLLVGQRATLPAEVKQDLLMVGLTHIIAVSGYNLTIILHSSRRLLAKHSKRFSTFLSFALIAVFLLLAGTSASIVRAAIVSTLSIVTAYYGRELKPLNLLTLAAAITAWANPFYLWSDISWYLSFLAFYGVMILAPLIQARFPGRWHDSIIAAVALESVCAETMSLPYVLHNFGQMSLIGLPANVLVVSLVPLAMLLSLVAGLAGMLAGSLAGWLAWPALTLLNYMLDVAHFMAHIPHVFIQNRSLSLIAMLGLYGLIIGLTTVLHHKTKRLKGGTITDRDVWSQQMVND
ncbi:MAG TPA: ComEC/Rec2 family competence protein [Candidatus Saccharimonadales bacterium]|jgi:competence protein ComEC|nr:ComEC/Rec2 family competence protein [Candidatus Saccharimonadales bacterium]